MPGILPMKVIKVGSNAQARIAQACDRCRSKKIRCDGIRPCCTQCANVGFECRTSDKLSRRAFPRGYTESLEERVRALETEVRDLKNLVDEKDEKLDIISRLHPSSGSRTSPKSAAVNTSDVNPSSNSEIASSPTLQERLHVQHPPYLTNDDGMDTCFAGLSSSRAFIETLATRLQQNGPSPLDIEINLLLPQCPSELTTRFDSPVSVPEWKSPPRLFSDQLVNIFFQEWAPLFPVLHRPTFLGLYERYMFDPDSVSDYAEIAQLNLVFGIAAISNGARASVEVDCFAHRWKAVADTLASATSLSALQALILAQLFCIQQGDLVKLSIYKTLSIAVSARLGLHQSQKPFGPGKLDCEIRQRTFWVLYTLDSFTAAILGQPKHIKDGDIQCEHPSDADDECITAHGFVTPQPGEPTHISSALVLFRAARILSEVLETCFPARTSHEISLHTLTELTNKLDAWYQSLPPNLSFRFLQDRPSTETVNGRSLLVTLAYHYIRALIQRPAMYAKETTPSSHLVAMADSSKRMIQVIGLLEERGLKFSFCVNRDELLVLSGFGVVCQARILDQDSKVLQDACRTISIVLDLLGKSVPVCAAAFDRAVRSWIPAVERLLGNERLQSSPSRRSIEINTPFNMINVSPRNAIAPSLDALQTHNLARNEGLVDPTRRMSMPNTSVHRNDSLNNRTSPTQAIGSNPLLMRRGNSPLNPTTRRASSNTPQPAIHRLRRQYHQRPHQHAGTSPTSSLPNLDYLSFDQDTILPSQQAAPPPEQQLNSANFQPSNPTSSKPPATGVPSDWERLLGNLDNGDTNIYDASYGGPPIDALFGVPSLTGGVGSGRADNTRPHRAETGLTPDHLSSPSPSLLPPNTSQHQPAEWNPHLWPQYRANPHHPHPGLSHTDPRLSSDDMNLTPSRMSNSILSSSTATDDTLSIPADDLMNPEWASGSSGGGSNTNAKSHVHALQQQQHDVLHSHNQNWVGGGGGGGGGSNW